MSIVLENPGPVFGPGFRWDGTITAGNLLTAISMTILIVVWGVRLEGRVNLEDHLRQALEASMAISLQDLKASQQSEIRHLEQRIALEAQHGRRNAADIKAWLQRIDDRLNSVIIPGHTRPGSGGTRP